MRLSTKGRYAVMAMADLAGMPPIRSANPARVPGRHRRSARKFRCPIWSSFSPSCGAAGWSPACAGRAAAIAWPALGRAAHRRHHPGGGRADRGHALQDRQRQGLHQARARAASPTICGKNWAGRSMCSCRRFRWPMWWSGGCWAAPSPATTSNAVAERRGGSGLSA